jgi:hypothetical protein
VTTGEVTSQGAFPKKVTQRVFAGFRMPETPEDFEEKTLFK